MLLIELFVLLGHLMVPGLLLRQEAGTGVCPEEKDLVVRTTGEPKEVLRKLMEFEKLIHQRRKTAVRLYRNPF